VTNSGNHLDFDTAQLAAGSSALLVNGKRKSFRAEVVSPTNELLLHSTPRDLVMDDGKTPAKSRILPIDR
jgi:hypothetical protein